MNGSLKDVIHHTQIRSRMTVAVKQNCRLLINQTGIDANTSPAPDASIKYSTPLPLLCSRTTSTRSQLAGSIV
jgi:hypothetical protein